jgi:receptor protein-tyrosine kinase
VGEISDALRRARGESRENAEEHTADESAAASERIAKRVERRPDASRRRPEPATAPIAEDVEVLRRTLAGDREGEWQARAVAVDRHSSAAESCRHLALRVRAELERRSLRSVAVTGPLRGEGKTTVACNLALALASVSRGREIALVDLDLRRPRVAADCRLPAQTGIEEYLAGRPSLREVCIAIEKPAVDVFPALTPQESAHELLVQPSFAALVQDLERRYSVAVFDTPPTLLVPDTRLILDQVGSFIAVARCGDTRERALRSMLDLLPRERLLGTVLNEGPLPTHSRQYAYYGGDSSSLERQE